VLALAGVDRIDLLGRFSVPVKVVDQVYYEITKPANDPKGAVAAALGHLHNRIEVVETNVGVGFQTRLGRDPQTLSSNLGEIAVDEYATTLAHSTGPAFVPLVLFEDPDVLSLRVGRLKGVHLLNTTAWLLTLHREGLLPEGMDLVERINASRKTPMVPFERAGRPPKYVQPGCEGVSGYERRSQGLFNRRRAGPAGEGQNRSPCGDGVVQRVQLRRSGGDHARERAFDARASADEGFAGDSGTGAVDFSLTGGGGRPRSVRDRHGCSVFESARRRGHRPTAVQGPHGPGVWL
jgi:hypothetical protein